MNMLRCISVFIMTLSCAYVVGQNSVPQIMERESSTEKIQKCRKLVYDNTLNSRDTATVHELLNYAQSTLETELNIAFTLDEYRMLFLLNGFYTDFINSVKTIDDSTYYARSVGKNSVVNDRLYYFALSRLYTDEVIDSISSSTAINDDEKRFISLYIDYLMARNSDALNDKSNAYLATAPAAPFERYTRKYIRHVYEPFHKFGFDIEYTSGVRIMTQSAADIDNLAFAWGAKFSLLYRRFVFQMGFDRSFGRAHSKLLIDDHEISRDKRYANSSMTFFAGYLFPIAKSWYLLPTAGVQFSQLEEYRFWLKTSYSDDSYSFSKTKPGFAIEFGRILTSWHDETRGGDVNSWSMHAGLRYAYMPTTFQLQSGTYDGVTHCITLTAGFSFSRGRRVY
ncbi:MAG: hypothetical protein J6Y72_00785 [Bacteroidales bacterium]|nr:hypothetical protein [Bacteroidales bacterium]